MLVRIILLVLFSQILNAGLWNNPYPANENKSNILYSSFSERPKHLDPAKAYSSNEYVFIGQIYEPLLQYNYFKRPYKLEPLISENLPEIRKEGNKVVYKIKIKPNVFYQPHPALYKTQSGKYVYHNLTNKELDKIKNLDSFKNKKNYITTRELTANDYVYQIKRLADPKNNSPIYGLMSEYILGMKDFRKQLHDVRKNNNKKFIDLNNYNLSGVQTLDKYSYEIILDKEYPQFIYWLAMPFFASMPWEAEKFYLQLGLEDKNITLDWHPIGTGPYMLTKNDPNKIMLLEKNPNFHLEYFPEIVDIPKNLKNSNNSENQKFKIKENQKLPFIDKVIFTLEKESVPSWNKFLQGYYDYSGIASDNFAQAIQSGEGGNFELTDYMKTKGITLKKAAAPSIFYWGFNMLDPVIGGYTEDKIKLRQAISIAFDINEYIEIFLNGRGIAANGPIPPEIFGSSIENKNKYLKYNLRYARKLLKEAGYPDGYDIKNNRPLTINFEAVSNGGPDDRARFNWLREQFQKLNIQLNVRVTQYNRFMEKMRSGKAQMYSWGWNADYPDPENFLFLFESSQGKVEFQGENASNYSNKEYDKLFNQMRYMKDSPERLKIINKMLDILQKDSPWIWGFYPMSYSLSQSWNGPYNILAMGNNTVKYKWLDTDKRNELRKEWNKPKIYPFVYLIIIIAILLAPVIISYFRKQYRAKKTLDF